VVDFSGRAYCRAELGLSGARLGELAGENVQHFFWSLASAARITLHVDVLAGENAHHKAEASFKALALALREALALAVRPSAAGAGVAASGPESTKGAVVLEELGEQDWARASARLKGGPDVR
jgi:imidazoleglycerol phosphate dehydratase HisB